MGSQKLRIADSPAVVAPKKNIAVVSQPQQNDTAALPTALSTGKITALDSFRKDFTSGKMTQKLCKGYILNIKNPFCSDKYIYHPAAGETYGDFDKRYAGVFNPGELRKGGQAEQVPGNPEITPIILPMEFDKEALDKKLGM